MKKFICLIAVLLTATSAHCADPFVKGELLTAAKLNAVNATVVHKAETETISGDKTFTGATKVKEASPAGKTVTLKTRVTGTDDFGNDIIQLELITTP